MAKKVTKAQRNSDIIALLQHQPVKYGTTVADAIAHLAYENNQLAKKNSGGKKLTKAQEENEVLKSKVLDFLSTQTEGVTATQVMTACGLTSNQKATSLLRTMVTAGTVTREVVKGKSLFSLAGIPTETETEGI